MKRPRRRARAPEAGPGGDGSRDRRILPLALAGGALGLAAIGAIVVLLVFVRSGGGSASPQVSATTPVALDIPAPAAPEPVSHSAAADLLANTSFDDMTQAERDLVRTEIKRVYANAAFRASSATVPAIDIYRIDDHTRVSRQFKPATDASGNTITVETLVFYCDSTDGNIAAFGYTITPVNVSSAGTRLKAQTQPFDALVSGLDWSQVKDLGFATINGHRTHGFEMPFHSPATGTTITTRSWFDVESARIIEQEQTGAGGITYTFDWSVPAPVVIPAGQPVASCSGVFYEMVPSARPPGTASPTTPAAGASPTH